MFKKLPLNNEYSFNFNGDFRVSGQPAEWLTDERGFVCVPINGRNCWFDRVWLGLVSHYEIDLPIEELLNINFVECLSKVIGLKCGKLMVFKKPIHFGDGFYIVPGFTRFAINNTGVVKSTKYNRVLKPSLNPYGYPYVNVYDADKTRWRSVCLHILLARTFVKNPEPEVRFFVNHKDGIKTNYELKNLEWVTSTDNQTHAVENGLRNDAQSCTLIDISTNSETVFVSVSTALKSIGYRRSNCRYIENSDGEYQSKLLFNRYIVKLHSGTPIKLGGGDYVKPRKILAVCMESGVTNEFPSLRKACIGLDVDKRTLKNRLLNGKPLKNWKIIELDSTNSPTDQ